MAALKEELRRSALAVRAGIPADDQQKAARCIVSRFFEVLSIKPGSVVAGYWPTRAEIDIRPLLHEIRKRGGRIVLPTVADFKKPLIFREWLPETSMIDGRFGIKQPDPESSDAFVPSLLLVPMLAFDLKGHRLGYGSGFYDRTFASFEGVHDFKAIGMAYEVQMVDHVPTDEHDYRMDMIITEQYIRTFERRRL